jgi:hypothetical protein
MLPDIPPDPGNEDPGWLETCQKSAAKTGRPPILALIVDDPPHRSDPPSVQQDKAIAATRGMVILLRERGENVRYGGLLSGGAR